MLFSKFFSVLLLLGVCGCSSYNYLTKRPNDFRHKVLDDMYPVLSADEYKELEMAKTDEEIRKYVDNFWGMNDPTPDTPENELREEYEKRLAFANEHFPDLRGWGRSDMKRIYLQYGEPMDVQHINWTDDVLSSGTRIKAAEIWLYPDAGKNSYYQNYFDKTFPGQKKFIFYDTIGSGVYRLAYSTEDIQDIDAILWKGVQDYQFRWPK
ncbi:MAG TPA: GWxTD domain-containing protein [Ignavibacteriales bacterium]|nr:GWxTD domain-containing protein [Ignavibacteriales bacterium]